MTRRSSANKTVGSDVASTAFRQASAPLALLDLEFRFVSVNDLYCDVVGRTEETLLGRSLFDVFPDDPAGGPDNGSGSLQRSLQAAVDTGVAQSMSLLRYDIENPEAPGEFIEHYWSVTNSAVRAGSDDRVSHILNHPTEVTSFIEDRLRQQASGSRSSSTSDTGQAVDNVYSTEVERLEVVNSLVQALVACGTIEQVAQTVTRDGLAAVGATAGSYVAVDGERFHKIAAAGLGTAADRFWKFEPDPTRSDPYSDVVAGHEPIFLRSAQDFESVYPHIAAAIEVGHEAWAFLPLVLDGGVIGVLGLVYDRPEPFTPAVRLQLYTLANLTRQAASRATQIAEQSVTIDSIQAVLEVEVDDVPGVDTSTLYRAASHDGKSGGDWFDVIALDPDHTLFVIGDVASHGPGAVGEMARARSTIHAYALEHLLPEQIVGLAARMLDRLASTHTTAVVAIYESSTGLFTWTSAGHPFPVSVAVDGATTVLQAIPGPPLGSGSHTGTRRMRGRSTSATRSCCTRTG